MVLLPLREPILFRQNGISASITDESFTSDGSLDTTINWIPGLRNMGLKDMPCFIRTTDPNDIMLNYLQDEALNCLKASAIIVNTFDELEYEVLQAIYSKSPRIYTMGAIFLSSQARDLRRSQVIELKFMKRRLGLPQMPRQKGTKLDRLCNYGSVTVMSDHGICVGARKQ
ncbi:linamarin synthase 1-like [Actinidia eriantha]|uniref:linamarin synthase 1-like n=1 Tax=Actinidia eriantha TaxID=165200 RepID=UPI002588109D|nr:linamarin synthase 1-like [Actinidia eriantha]